MKGENKYRVYVPGGGAHEGTRLIVKDDKLSTTFFKPQLNVVLLVLAVVVGGSIIIAWPLYLKSVRCCQPISSKEVVIGTVQDDHERFFNIREFPMILRRTHPNVCICIESGECYRLWVLTVCFQPPSKQQMDMISAAFRQPARSEHLSQVETI